MDRNDYFMGILRDNDNYFRNIYNYSKYIYKIFTAYNTIFNGTNNILISNVCIYIYI